MKHDNARDSDMGINLYGLNSGINTPGYQAVKKAAVELSVEKMLGVTIATDSRHKKGPKKHSRK